MKILKRIAVLICILVVPAIVKAQRLHNSRMPDSVKSFMDTVVNIFRRNELNKDSIDWNAFRNDISQKVDTITTIKGLIPTIRYMFDQLHDNHGNIVYKGMPY